MRPRKKDVDRHLRELSILRNEVARLKASEREYIQTKETLQKKTHALGERVKELKCLYTISSLVEKHGISLEKILQGVVDIIPSAWQYPDITCARIALGGQMYATANFVDTSWKQTANILVRGKREGILSVCYVEERPNCGEGPFLREERSLINAVAKRIGEIVERKNAEEALRESTARNKALLNAIPDLIFRMNKDGIILDLKSGKDFGARPGSGTLIGRSAYDLPELYRTFPKEAVQQGMKNVSQVLETGRTQIYEYRTLQGGNVYHYEVLLTMSGHNEILGIIRDITERRALEKQVIEISEWERQRIGQDLHDSLCQQLAGIAYLGKVLQRKMRVRSFAESRDAGEIVSLIDDAITQTKGFARGLCPVRLEENGLMMALSALTQNVEKLFGISCRLGYDKPVLFSDNIMATHIYRIVQEAVNNAIKHGKATRIGIKFADDNGISLLTIKDNGSGFRGASKNNRGMGMSTMRHRANMIGATLDIKSNPGGGTIVACSFQSRQGERRA